MRLERIVDEGDIRAAYRSVFSAVTKETKPRKTTVGYHSNNVSCRVAWNDKYGFWTMYPPKGWDNTLLIFGTQNPINHRSGSLNITCQINVFKSPAGYRRAGAILSNGRNPYLGHNGGIGGSKPGISKGPFLSWYRENVSDTVDVEDDNGRGVPFILIGKIAYSPTFLAALAKFIFAVERFKKERDLNEPLEQHLKRDADEADDQGEFQPGNTIENRAKVIRAINLRRGQPQFRRKLLTAYGGRCAICDCDCVDALEAAHIRPYGGKESNHVQNGLLLRSDIHVLFDLGKIGVDPATFKVIVAKGIRSSVYGKFHGKSLNRPNHRWMMPNMDVLQEHRKKSGL